MPFLAGVAALSTAATPASEPRAARAAATNTDGIITS